MTEADVLFVRDEKFPTGRLGEHLFDSDIDQEN